MNDILTYSSFPAGSILAHALNWSRYNYCYVQCMHGHYAVDSHGWNNNYVFKTKNDNVMINFYEQYNYCMYQLLHNKTKLSSAVNYSCVVFRSCYHGIQCRVSWLVRALWPENREGAGVLLRGGCVSGDGESQLVGTCTPPLSQASPSPTVRGQC